jgi:hypothetical protein
MPRGWQNASAVVLVEDLLKAFFSGVSGIKSFIDSQ